MSAVPRIRLRVLPQILPVPNTLSIGTVTAGDDPTDAAASVSGTVPNQVLNLRLPPGPPGPTLTFKGDWVTGISYQKYDSVTFGGSSYACEASHTSGVFADDLVSGDWRLIAEKGDQGDVGPQGPVGPTGIIFDGTTGLALVGNGGTGPTYRVLPLGTGVTGILPVANGGTGAATSPANEVFAGPMSGSAAAPGLRALVAADVPAIATVATRTALAALPNSVGAAWLEEARRQGNFVWNSANFSSQVTADTAQAIYVPPATDTSGASGAWVRAYQFIDPDWFSLSADGSNDALMFGRMFSFLNSFKGMAIVPPRVYSFLSQVVITANSIGRSLVAAYGAEFHSGAFSPFKISGGGYAGGLTLAGFFVNHSGNSSAPSAFMVRQASSLYLIDPSVNATGTVSSYICVDFEQSNPADENTGCFWCLVENPQFYATAGNFEFGILAQGAINSLTVRGGEMSSPTYGVYLDWEPGSDVTANSVTLDNVAFEGFAGAAVSFNGRSSATVNGSPYGLKITNCRAESGSVFLIMANGAGINTSEPPFLSGNTMIGVSAYISNAPGLRYKSLDALGNVQVPATTVSSLPSASAVGAGTRSFVTDASASTFGTTAAGGGSNKVPVTSNGTNWIIG